MTQSPIPNPQSRFVYVHVPFCARRCTYCDFSIAVRRRLPVDEYLEALSREAARAGLPREPRTLYLGGGTPSILGAEDVARLAGLLTGNGRVEEFTLEANPENVTREAARAWVAAGVNRLSLGAQSFDEKVLRWMHRTHDSAAIGAAVRAAREAGISNLSLDLIFALPEWLGRDFAADLERAVALEPEHISLYGLTVEPGTVLARRIARGEESPAADDRYEAEYLLAHQRLAGEGYRFYEVSNAARPGREAVHNAAYWKLAPYLGLGPGAHSFDGSARWWNEPAYARWARLLREARSPVAGRELLNPRQRSLERLYLALRTAEGLELTGIGDGGLGIGKSETAEAGDKMRLLRAAEVWVRSGWAQWNMPRSSNPQSPVPNPRLSLTPLGWLRLDELVASI